VQGFYEERLKGLEPSTFCTANGTCWTARSTKRLQRKAFSVVLELPTYGFIRVFRRGLRRESVATRLRS
jgi:hypothetical protein